MRLAAVSQAEGVDVLHLSGVAAAVFERSCLVDRRGGRLIALADEAFGNMPGAVLVALPAGFRFLDHVAPGAEAFVRGGVLRFAASPLSVDLRPVVSWSSGIAALGLDMRRAPVRAAWERARASLDTDARARPLLALAGPAIAALSDAVTRRDHRAVILQAARLVGLGDGATPAGDDFLVGFVAGLRASAKHDIAATLGAAIAAHLHRTSRASRVYLEAATAGQVSQRLTDLAAALAEGDIQATEAATRAALAVGHSSGACGMLGLLQGAVITMIDASPTVAANA